MQTGRNEPCPCGSGKKYKKCCLDTDQRTASERLQSAQEPRAQVPGSAPELAAMQLASELGPTGMTAMSILSRRDVKALQRHLDRLHHLLTRHASLLAVRFDPPQFKALVEAALFEVQDSDDPLNALYGHCAAELVSEEFRQRFMKAMHDLHRQPGLATDDRLVVAVMLMSTALVAASPEGYIAAHDMAIEMIFRVQYEEVFGTERAQIQQLVETITSADMGGLTPSQTLARLSGEHGDLLAQLEQNPLLQAAAARKLDEAHRAVLAMKRLPSFLPADELLLLALAVNPKGRHGKGATKPTGEALNELKREIFARVGELNEAGMAERVGAHLEALIAAGDVKRRELQRLVQLRSALWASPGHVLMHALSDLRCVTLREKDEGRLLTAVITTDASVDAVEEYCAFLTDHGDAEAAARVQSAAVKYRADLVQPAPES